VGLSFPHFVRSAAELELDHALDSYALDVPDELVALETAIDEVIERVTDNPLLARQRVKDMRCAFVHGFPCHWYIWRAVDQVVEVIASLHARQDNAVLLQRR